MQGENAVGKYKKTQMPLSKHSLFDILTKTHSYTSFVIEFEFQVGKGNKRSWKLLI